MVILWSEALLGAFVVGKLHCVGVGCDSFVKELKRRNLDSLPDLSWPYTFVHPICELDTPSLYIYCNVQYIPS